MKFPFQKLRKLLAGLVLALAPAPAAAQAADAPAVPAIPADADPALWVVRDADTTIYLFGTFHLLDSRPWFDDQVRAAFDSSNELVLEAIIPDDPAAALPLLARYAVDPEGRRLSERLTPEQRSALDRALGEAGIPTGTLEPYEPWFAAMTLASAAGHRLGLDGDNGPERVLLSAARERGIPVDELEGMEWQLRLFDELPEEQQLAQLAQALEDSEALGGELAPMLAAWSAGDADALGRMLDDYRTRDPLLHDIVFTRRNAAWAEWIARRMERPGTVFFAVGAGHLAGGDSVQAALAAHGIAAERLPGR